MRALIEGQPDITLEEIKEEMKLGISISAISRKIKHKLGFNFKKNSTGRGRERREEPETKGRVYRRARGASGGQPGVFG
jgi:transposase